MRILFAFIAVLIFQIQTAEASGRRVACRSFVASKMRSLPSCQLTEAEKNELKDTLMEYCSKQMLQFSDPKMDVSAEKISVAMDGFIGASCPTQTAAAPRPPRAPEVSETAEAGQ